MIKQTLYFSNPTYLTVKNSQLVITIKREGEEQQIIRPVEDLEMIILDTGQITITHQAIKALQVNKTAIVSCDDSHMPTSIMLPLEGHSEQSERYRKHLAISAPLKKNLWQQTVVAKIKNQRAVLQRLDKPTKRLDVLLGRVNSGDPENIEGQAAAYYWRTYLDGFIRDRYGEPPNQLLNYGYAIIRAMIARALCSSGLILSLGIHHRNKYNAYCLADDIMEPFRPFIDLIAYNLYQNENLETFLSPKAKRALLSVGQVDTLYGKRKSPLQVGMAYTTASLYQCISGDKRKIKYPQIV